MQADVAAAYCGERHVEDFLERVGKQYPEPRWVESARRRFWYRPDLDRALGIAQPVPTGMGERFALAIQKEREAEGDRWLARLDEPQPARPRRRRSAD